MSARLRLLLLLLGIVGFAAFNLSQVPAAGAGKIRMVFPGPVTTFSLPYLVAQKHGWMEGLEVDDR
jgi:hypothetical protein